MSAAPPISRRSFIKALALGAPAALLASVSTAANPGLPPPVRTADGRPIIRDWLAEHRRYADWHLTLLDPLFMVPATYAPSDLVTVSSLGVAGAGSVRRHVGADLVALDHAARATGIRLRVVSAYRSHARQAAVFASWVERSGYERALRYSARAGHSEHQLGTTLDLSFAGGADPWAYPDFARTTAGAWLARHAWRFGFVMSYPKGLEARSGYAYEPWHYRYLGRERAAAWRATGLTLREWLWRRG